MKEIYLDNAATTKIDKDVLDTMMNVYEKTYGNASSVHIIGRNARCEVENSRETVAKIINCNPNEIYFTSCGSESDNIALLGIARANKHKGNHIITSKIEHPAVLETCSKLEEEGFEVTYLPVDKNGVVDIEILKASIRPTTILISIMFANNEIGVIEPIKEIGKIAHNNNIYFHTDAVQAVGSLNIDTKELNIDSLSLSGHKFYGPKGVGVLYLKSGIDFNKLLLGGHQERNKRAGTENVPGIVGLAKAMEISYEKLDENTDKIRYLRDYYESEVKRRIPNISINGEKSKRLPGCSNISFDNVSGETLLINLDMKGICTSSGSACTSGSLEASHVLTSIGLSELKAKSSLRISIGKNNTKEEIDYLIDSLEEIVTRQRCLNEK